MGLLSAAAVLALFLLNPLVAVAKTDVYRMGVERINYWPQWAFDDNEYMGFARDFFDLFSHQTKVGFSFKVLPIKRLYHEFLPDNAYLDFKFPDNPKWKVELKAGKTIHYSQPILSYTDGVVVLPKNKGRGLKRLKVLGTAMGFTLAPGRPSGRAAQ